MDKLEPTTKLRHLERAALMVLATFGLGVVAIWGFTEGRQELAKEAEREQPVKAPQHISMEGGETVITLKVRAACRQPPRSLAIRPPVVVNVFGDDLDVLDTKAQEIARALNGIPGAMDVQIQSPPGLPQLSIRLRKQDLERWGFDAVNVLDFIRAAYQGDTVGQGYEANRVFPIIVILSPRSRQSVTQVSELPLRAPSGAYVRLKQLGDIYETSGRYQVLHQGARRVQTVTANVAGRDVASFVADAKAQLAARVSLSAGNYLEFAGAAEAQSQTTQDLLLNALIAGVGIVLLLSMVTRNLNNLLLVLVNLPFALAGGVFAVFASGGLLSLGSMVGFVTLFGITLRNSILMITHYEHLVCNEGRRWDNDTAIRGAADRLAAILMTSLA